jgi:acyl carrier protein
MNNSTLIGVADVGAAVVETLAIEDRADSFDADTKLTSIPELDSLAIIELVVEFERRFGIAFDDDDMTAEVFETIGSLTAFLDSKAR